MAVVGVLALVYILVSSSACPIDARFTEIAAEGEVLADPEYRWNRDSSNYCRWTLWDADGNPAPEEAYTAHESSYPGPTPRPLTGFWLWMGGSAGLLAAGVARRRSASNTRTGPPDLPSASDDN